MAAQNALPLRDMHLPDTPLWWPPAPGWWLLAALAVAALLAWHVSKRWRAERRLRKSALEQLKQIHTQFGRDGDALRLVRSLSVLMRRACVSFYPRHTSAGLTGTRWLRCLDQKTTEKGFTEGVGKVLSTAPYLPDNSTPGIDTGRLLGLCEAWLRQQPQKSPTGRGCGR